MTPLDVLGNVDRGRFPLGGHVLIVQLGKLTRLEILQELLFGVIFVSGPLVKRVTVAPAPVDYHRDRD